MQAEQKRRHRQQLRSLRRQLPRSKQRLAAQRLARHVVNHPLYWRTKKIALYLANDGEIATDPLLKKLWRCRKACYLPVLKADGSLTFKRYLRHSKLVRNRFGIPEPTGREECRAWMLDMVLMPLVAFDRQGGRLGMGGGFYDRTFDPKRQRVAKQPALIGLAHAFQELPSIPTEPWDIPLSAVATDCEWIAISSTDAPGK